MEATALMKTVACYCTENKQTKTQALDKMITPICYGSQIWLSHYEENYQGQIIMALIGHRY